MTRRPHGTRRQDCSESTCERKGWAEDARAYNDLVIAWPELEKLAASAPSAPPSGQFGLDLGGVAPTPARKRAPRSRKKASVSFVPEAGCAPTHP